MWISRQKYEENILTALHNGRQEGRVMGREQAFHEMKQCLKNCSLCPKPEPKRKKQSPPYQPPKRKSYDDDDCMDPSNLMNPMNPFSPFNPFW